MAKERNDFELQWHGGTVVIIPAGSIESMRWDLIESAAEVVLEPLRKTAVPMVVFDLSEVSYFGSVFIALLLRCHTLVKKRGGEMVIAGAADMVLELLKVTNLDTLWALYDTRDEALAALSG